jgi:hypothetical protein
VLLILLSSLEEGVGKSETARLIAEAILARRERIGTTQRQDHLSLALSISLSHFLHSFNPVGYLVLRGEEYSETSDAFFSGGVTEVCLHLSPLIFLHTSQAMSQIHRRINVRIVEHMRRCGSGGVVVFDEVQKVYPGTLDVGTLPSVLLISSRSWSPVSKKEVNSLSSVETEQNLTPLATWSSSSPRTSV